MKNNNKKNSDKPMKIQLEGYEVVEKVPTLGGNSARVYLPKEWIGKKVKVILIEK